jgi:bis(5'-nucleosidyl)-tetraphosphatase
MPLETSAGIIVFFKEAEAKSHENIYLILHYSEGHHDLPKGHLEGSETPEQAAVRETREETGLDVFMMPGFKEEIEYHFMDRTKGLIRKKVIFFLGESFSKEVQLSFEHQGYSWLGLEDAKRKVTFDSAKSLLAKADEFLRKHK